MVYHDRQKEVIRIINISHTDHANYGYHNAQALNMIDGVSANSFAFRRHQLRYPKQSQKVGESQMVREIRRADIVQVMHSDLNMVKYLIQGKAKKVIVWHTGTVYRQEHSKYNAEWSQYASKVIVALPEFMRLAPSPTYFGITYDVDSVTPNFSVGKPLRVGHYPSNRVVKGSNRVDTICRRIPNIEYKTGGIVEFEKQLARMQSLDVYVEMMNLAQGGKKYGCYGTTAIESASAGCIVLTNDLFPDVYQSTYGETALNIRNNPRQMFIRLKELAGMNGTEIMNMKKRTRQWVEDNHSYKAQGERLKKILNV